MSVRFKVLIATAASVICAFATTAKGAGEILVQVWNSSSSFPDEYLYSNGSNILIPIASGTTRVNIQRNAGAPAATDIGAVSFDGTTTNPFQLVLGASPILTSAGGTEVAMVPAITFDRATDIGLAMSVSEQ